MNSLRPKHKDSSFESKDTCEFEIHCWKLGEFTGNNTSHILNLMDETTKVFFTENE